MPFAAGVVRAASFGSILNRPWLLIVFSLVALAAWGAVTFAAVRLAIISAARVTRAGV
jgi:hypothetical protein